MFLETFVLVLPLPRVAEPSTVYTEDVETDVQHFDTALLIWRIAVPLNLHTNVWQCLMQTSHQLVPHRLVRRQKRREKNTSNYTCQVMNRHVPDNASSRANCRIL